MTLWLETIGVFGVACLGILLGSVASRSGALSRTAALTITFLLVALTLAGRIDALAYRWPELYALAAGRVRFVLLVFAVTLGLSTPLAQLTRPGVRMITCILIALFVSALTILPFVGPAAVQHQLLALKTTFDADGVCRQSQPFTCGAAAAVTGLRHLGFASDKGRLAVDARTSPVIGVSPWTLYQAIRRQYQPQGLECWFGFFDSLAQVPRDAALLAVMRDSAWGDHCVAVLEITSAEVVVADPALGLQRVPTAQFLRSWRGTGIVLRRHG